MKFTYKVFPQWLGWFSMVPDHRVGARCRYTLPQALFCGLMVFILRHRSLRAFTIELRGNTKALKNFRRWITIPDVPSDDEMRYILQTVSTTSLNNILKDFHARMARQKILGMEQKLLGRYDLVSMDGSGQISSHKIHCERCLTQLRPSGLLYRHSQLLLSLTGLNGSYALPLQFEPIERSDTETEYSKNDCELNAAKRAIHRLKSQFPKRLFCLLGDGLFAVEAITGLVKENGWSFLFTAKEERNQELFFMWEYLKESRQSLERRDSDGRTIRLEWHNGLPLRQTRSRTDTVSKVNLVTYREIPPDGAKEYFNAWITDIPVTKENVTELAKAGRARFAIENRNFNEQKNLGFQTEHNFGHAGNLPNVFFGLAQIAYLITELFRFWKPAKEWIKNKGGKRRYFESLAVLVSETILIDDDPPLLYLKFDFNTS